MLSCPAVLVLGEVRYKEYKGLSTLTLLYPRVSVLSKNGYVRVINTIPEYMDGRLIEDLCLDMLKSEREKPMWEAVRRTMFYGGYNVFLFTSNGSVVNVLLELIDTSRIHFYLKEAGGGVTVADLDHWIALGVGLRTGNYDLIIESCKEIGRLTNDGCVITSDKFELLITNAEKGIAGFRKILPDNNPVRHVVKL